MQIRTEAGPRLHIEPPLDYSEDFEPGGDETIKAKGASGDRPQVGLASACATAARGTLCDLPSFLLPLGSITLTFAFTIMSTQTMG